MKVLNGRVHLSTLILLVVGCFDLVTTLMWLNRGGGEGNPFFAFLASQGSLALVAGKLAFLFLPVMALEYARTKRPQTAELGTWVAAILYLFLYTRHILALRGM